MFVLVLLALCLALGAHVDADLGELLEPLGILRREPRQRAHIGSMADTVRRQSLREMSLSDSISMQ